MKKANKKLKIDKKSNTIEEKKGEEAEPKLKIEQSTESNEIDLSKFCFKYIYEYLMCVL